MIKKYIDILIKAILAGICIGVGGTILLSVKDSSLLGSITGAVFFALGLMTILICKLNLFTGKIGYLLRQPITYIINLLIIWFGNLIGTYLTGTVLTFTRYKDSLQTKAFSICNLKLEDSIISILILSIFCGILMYIAVNGYKRVESAGLKLAIVILPVAVFILCGFEHVVANMFYFSVANLLWSWQAWAYLGIMTLGNGLGSILFDLLLNYKED